LKTAYTVGLFVLSEEYKMIKGSYASEETRRKMSESRKGAGSYLYGKHFPEEAKQKMRETCNRRNNILKLYKTFTDDRKTTRMHRHVFECAIGRKLKPFEIVHHKDKNKLNNDINNLQLMSKKEHNNIHQIGFKTRFKKKYQINREDILIMYETMTMKEIADIYGCKTGGIQYVLKGAKRRIVYCKICGKKAIYRKTQLCPKHYMQDYNSRCREEREKEKP